MGISDRIEGSLEKWSEKWKLRLGGWIASWLGFGIEVFFDILGKAAAPKLKPLIDAMEATGKVPPELAPILAELRDPTTQAGAIFANSAGNALIGGALGKIVDAIFLPMAYAINSGTRNVILAPPQLLSLWHRGKMTEEKVNEYLGWLGYDDTDIEHWKLMSWFLPGPMDLVRWQAKEVFEPEMIARYGLDDEFEGLKHEDFRKVGVTEEHEKNFWRAHWEHASWNQVVEMLHRGLLTEEQVWEWFRLVEIPPFWRQLLIDSAYTWPTRVDVRRWWDMRTIDEAELRRLYSGMGYRGVNLDNYVLWTKVYVAFPDLLARWKNGWISLDDVKAELAGYGMPEDRIEEMIQTKIKAAQPERTAKERDLTATDIIAGVKKGIITQAEGIELLMDLGYDEDEAEFKIAVKIAVEGGSPETFEEFKDLTQKWRKAVGREAKPVSEELKKAAAEVIKLTDEIVSLQRAIEEEEKTLIDEEVLPEAATAKRDELQVTLHRAEAELQRAQGHYDSLKAQWQHGQ